MLTLYGYGCSGFGYSINDRCTQVIEIADTYHVSDAPKSQLTGINQFQILSRFDKLIYVDLEIKADMPKGADLNNKCLSVLLDTAELRI